MRVLAVATLLAAVAPVLPAQDGPPGGGDRGRLGDRGQIVAGGTVTGTVVAADTQRPARFARVRLVPVSELSGDSSRSGFEPGEGPRGRTTGETDFDGAFTIVGVPAGDYYAVATATGYVSEGSLLQEAQSAGEDTAALLAALPTVHVSGSGSATINLRLERGAVIAGRVQWDDGSPAAGIEVTAWPGGASAANGGGASGTRSFSMLGGRGGSSVQTDDRGRFRLINLAAGKYVVRASAAAPMEGSGAGRSAQVAVYAPATPRREAATVLELKRGEEREGVAVTMNLNGMHSVAGTVSVVGGGAPLTSGFARLSDPGDAMFQRSARLGGDGRYLLQYVPPGTYTLTVSGFTTTEPGAAGVTFAPATQTVVVTDGDLSGVDVTLTPRSAGTP